MEKDKGRITISVTHGQHFHEIEVADNGCGMSADTIQNLFVPYFTTKPTGVGLGLAATEAIIVSHKATISVSSETGEGTIFTLVFPAV
jgi:signal transduction histidine kinase